MHRTNIYLDETQTEALDRLATEEGTSRAELIRRVIDQWLAGGDSTVEADLDAIDASFGILSGVAALDRKPDERAEHLDRIWRRGA